MWLALLTYQLASLLLAQAQNVCFGHSTFRRPANSDIEVICGSQTLELRLLLCPIYFNGYNSSLVSLNSQHSNLQCKGTADWMAEPPVIKFKFPITEEGITACFNELTVSDELGTGQFSDISKVQYITISGMVCSKDIKTTITYQQEVMYKFSCHYPLQYLVNNTHMAVSGVSLAVKDNNGSFISTLSMGLYADNQYTRTLQIPSEGLELKTRIFVQVKASNLTNRFNVVLDRCYATTSPLPINTTHYDLFVGCQRDSQTVLGVNGNMQKAEFSFEAFRFIHVPHSQRSTYYLHCITRLCMSSICHTLIQNCTSSSLLRRRRSVTDNGDTKVTEEATISSGPISIHLDDGYLMASGGDQQTHTVVVVAVIAGIVGVVCLTLVAFIVYKMQKSKISSAKKILYPQE